MIPVACLPAVWALFVVAIAVSCRRRRLPPARDIVSAADRGAGDAARPLGARLDRWLQRVGSASLRLRPASRRESVPSEADARRTGAVVVIAVLAVLAHPLAGVTMFALGLAAPALARRRHERARVAAIEAELPDLVDLFLLAVDAGLTVPLAVAAVARRAPGRLAGEFAVVVAEVERGRRIADALDQVPDRTAEAVRPLTAALVSSERYGTPVAAALDRLAVEVRISAQRRAEEFARRIPVTLLFPLVLCILPAFALLTVAPLVANGLRSLRL